VSYDLSEIEKRLQMAAAYRKLIDYKVLTGTEVDDAVTDEVRDFAKGRLEVLLGVRADAESAAHFTTTEVLALKALARKLLEPKSEQSSEEDAEESPVFVAPKKKVQKAPAPKPKAQKQQKVVVTAPPPEPEPEPEESEDDNVKYSFEDAEVGDIVVEGYKRYEIIEIEGKKFPKDITKQAVASGRVPMPNLQHAMQQLAYESLAVSSDPMTQAMIAASLGT
jgi:outer membrane biosynthesis protein TonB